MTWEHVVTFVSLITAVIAAVIAIRKSPHETNALDGDAANKFATAAGLTADQNIKLQEKMEELEGRIHTVEEKNNALTKKVDELEQENRDLQEWAECLCGQVKELGGRPVLLRSKVAGK